MSLQAEILDSFRFANTLVLFASFKISNQVYYLLENITLYIYIYPCMDFSGIIYEHALNRFFQGNLKP